MRLWSRPRVWTPLLLAAGLFLPTAACGNNGPDGPDGGPRFLIAHENRLGQLTLGAREPKQLSQVGSAGYVLDPAVSPDGRNIAFVYEQAAHTRADGTLDFGSDLYLAGSDGAKPRPIVEHKDVGEYLESPAWLDGQTVYFGHRGIDQAAGRAFFRVERLNIASGARAVVLESAASPALTRDGHSLVYVAIDPETRLQSLLIGNPSGGDTNVLASVAEGFLTFESPAFSPDGSRVAFAATDLNIPPESTGPSGAFHPFAKDIWLIDKDGSGLRRIGELAESAPSITWSSDGGSIYVLGGSGIVRIDATTGVVTPVDPGRRGSDILLLD
jgi:Tol biopolymer transport system component